MISRYDVEEFIFEYVIPAILGLLILAAVALLGVACYKAINDPNVRSGWVRGKEFEPQHSESRPFPTGKTVIVMPIFVPDRWSLKVCTEPSEGDCSWQSVPQSTFDAAEIGSRIELRE